MKAPYTPAFRLTAAPTMLGFDLKIVGGIGLQVVDLYAMAGATIGSFSLLGQITLFRSVPHSASGRLVSSPGNRCGITGYRLDIRLAGYLHSLGSVSLSDLRHQFT